MNLSEKFHDLRTFARKDGTGVGASLLLHVLALCLIFYFLRQTLPQQPSIERFVPVSLVAQSEGPEPEPKQQKAAGAITKTLEILPRAPVAHYAPTATAPAKTTPPVDELEMQLKELSKLRQPNTDTRLLGDAGTTELAESGNDETSGGQGPYHSRDIIRAQILRRWSLDMTRLGNRNFTILIHVLLKRDGTVLAADIVDKQRYANDSAFRWIALSAKNAVILSSPLALPAGLDGQTLDLTLKLNPRDALQ